MKKYARTLFLFRRDLRMEDNTGLLEACAHSQEVLPCFILNHKQLEKNPYRGDHSVQFMLTSLQELQKALPELLILQGDPLKEISKLCTTFSCDAIYVNRDYTPFSRNRDAQIETLAKKKGVDFHQVEDTLLHPPESICTKGKKPYTVFTPFFTRAKEEPIANPRSKAKGKWVQTKKRAFPNISFKENSSLFPRGGRKEGKRLLSKVPTPSTYEKQRNIPALDATTHLSAHLKFGTLSVREVYHHIRTTCGPKHPLLRQLHWRDFFSHIGYHFPHVFGKPFRKKYEKVQWRKSAKDLRKWKEGKTGFPIVDAGMRELSTTGFMHNRIRMITAMFLVKDLHLDWREGEKHFAQHLVDYDPCVNNGNWQWAASTGCDAAPYFRIMNPWRQQERFDPDCAYIKRWVPELKDLTPKEIHTLHASPPPKGYPAPMVEHKVVATKSKAMFASL